MATAVTGQSDPRTETEPPDEAAGRGSRWSRITTQVVRFRLALVCLGFLALSLAQQPGRILGDTKLDLAVDPVGFLSRALTLWEPQGAAGQVQNQAYGYFFPMGPFFALGDLIGLPAWVVQRCWIAGLMSVAFLGVVILARRLGIGTPTSALVAGVAYALAPRMVTVLGAASIEVLPMALAPWVLIPLAGAARHGSARRAAAFSGVAVFCVGGVNAVATAAVLPLAVLFLLTRPAGPFRRRLMAWWVVSVGLAIAWWLGPLVLLGRFSAPFLYYIETAAVTTRPTDVLGVLRGTTHWVGGVPSYSDVPMWPAGWSLMTDAIPVAGTVVLAAFGLVALCRRDLPERTWLVVGLLAGVGLVSLGHTGAVEGLWAGPLNDALDGALAPLRNVHKFDPVLRLPLALGMAHLLGVVLAWLSRRRTAPAEDRRRSRRAGPVAAYALVAVLVLALISTISPALAGRLAPPTAFTEVPGYWEQTAEYLAEQQPSGRALLVPGSSFGMYEWGTTMDEPLQPLATSPWDVRNAIPFTPEGHIRMLDAVEERLARGEGSPGLAPYLARAGFSHLVLRNDLDTRATQATRAVLVRQALRESPGITPATTFGPVVATERAEDGRIYDAGLDVPAPAIEVFRVDGTVPQAWTTPLSSAVTVHGGPEALLELEDRDLITDRPTLMAGSTGIGTELLMVTDALVRRERNFGRLNNATSAGLTVDDEPTIEAPVRDYALPNMAMAESIVQYTDGEPSASSSAAQADGFAGTRRDTQPWAAVDGDYLTAWKPAPWDDSEDPAWWRLDTDRLFYGSEVGISFAREPGAARISEVRLATDAGEVTVPVADTDDEQILPLPEGYTRSLTITSTVPQGIEDGPQFQLADVRIPGIAPSRSTVTPAPARSASVYAFDAESGRSGCVLDDDGAAVCAAALVDGAEDSRYVDRTFSSTGWLSLDVFATGVARPGPALDALIADVRGTDPVVASSAQVADPRGAAIAAVDGDPGTAWMAEGGDRRPTLTFNWPEPRPIDSLRVVMPERAAVVPTAVTLDAEGTSTRHELADDGSVEFPEIVTDRLVVTFELPEEVEYLDPYMNWTPPMGLAVSELEFGDANPAADPGTEVVVPCGSGPTVQLDGAVLETSARTTLGALQNLEPARLDVCDADPFVTVPAGVHRMLGDASDVMVPDSVTLVDSVPVPRQGDLPSAPPGTREAADIERWDAEDRSIRVEARDEEMLLVVPENANIGWAGWLDGERLAAVTVDGWQQGYVIPPGAAGEVVLDFRPGNFYRAALAAGAGAVLLLLLIAALPARASRAGAPGPSRRGGRGSAVLAAVALVGVAVFGVALVGGLIGLACLAGVWAVAQVAGRRRTAVLGAVAASALVGSGAIAIIQIEGTLAAGQVLAMVALAAVVVGILPMLRGSATGRAAAEAA
jgi:arabinofuranan 3-O-arabinosyltransferase